MPLTRAEISRRYRARWPEKIKASNAVNNLKYHKKFYAAGTTYNSWRNMRARCSDPNDIGYHKYGGRGITYDPRWDLYATFLADMGERLSGKTLDRIDSNGPYNKDNCKWSTPTEQNLNRDFRRNVS